MEVKLFQQCDVDRAGAVFALLYTEIEPSKAFDICMELWAVISMLHLNNGNTVFSLKSCKLPITNQTVCGANMLGALSPISENESGI